MKLTEKQIKLLSLLPESSVWEQKKETPVDLLCDELARNFNNKPNAVGAIIGALIRKGVFKSAKQTDRFGYTAIYITLSEAGREALNNIKKERN